MKDERTFKEKMEQNVFSLLYLDNLKLDLEKQLKEGKVSAINTTSVKQKIRAISQHLEKSAAPKPTVPEKTSTKPTEATRKTITLNTTEKPVRGGDKEVTDESVARKFLQVKEGAKSRGIDFDLNLTSVRNLLKAKKCFYSSLPFDHTDAESSLTFDRLDYRKGYVKGNVVACRKSVNDLKNVLIEHPVSVFKDNPSLLKKVVEKWVI